MPQAFGQRSSTLLPPVTVFIVACTAAGAVAEQGTCDPSLTLPAGFCATVYAENVRGARLMAVADNGDLLVATFGRRGGDGGGVVGLRDTDGDGRADMRTRFGGSVNDVLLQDGHLYAAPNDGVIRYNWSEGSLEPDSPPDTIIHGLPATNSHRAKSIVIDRNGNLYVNIGSPSNVCSGRSQGGEPKGTDPCPELEARAGIWRFDANALHQTQADGVRFATGVRNAVALTLHPETDELYAVVHGRDRLHQSWPSMYNERDGAEKPAEEFIHIQEGDDFGWPYCYYDPDTNRKVLAPEYGGDGTVLGRCEQKKSPIYGFPGHWAPDGLLFYTGDMFPERYRSGAFVVFHGSWNRAPLPQAGYNVTFLPLDGNTAAGPHEVFADGFRGPGEGADHRPVGIVQAPDGAIFVSDDAGGTVWRITYHP